MAATAKLAALSDPTRRRVFELVLRRPSPVGRIASALPVSRPAVSQHLRVLLDAGLVTAERQGASRVYRADPRGLAELRGIRSGDMVVVRSRRGRIRLAALVTKRIRPLQVEGNTVHLVGLPLHWGFDGLTRPGHLVNTLTPFVGDPNVETPEFKAFLVDIQKA